jgi:hypothetical protein
MVAEAREWVQVQKIVQAWARANVASVDRRVFFGANNKAAYPQIVAFKIGGPDDAALIQFDVWANTETQAAQIAAELCTVADQLSRYEHEAGMLKGAVVIDSGQWQPDEESNKPRYIVQIEFSAWGLGPTPELS